MDDRGAAYFVVSKKAHETYKGMSMWEAYREVSIDVQCENQKLRDLLKKIEWSEWNDSDHGTQKFCTLCRGDAMYGHYTDCELGQILAP
jgi:hypothetical protein